jgi:hypothetical protein
MLKYNIMTCCVYLFLFYPYFLKFALGDDLNIWTLICQCNISVNSNQLSVLSDPVLHKILCQESASTNDIAVSDKGYHCPILNLFKLSKIDMSLSKIYFNIILSSRTVSKVITFHCDFHPKLWARFLFYITRHISCLYPHY